jgi:hypothetical protein
MSLDPGTRLGPYEIVALLGAGGMGEVSRRDTTLGRSVAIKILPRRWRRTWIDWPVSRARRRRSLH